jgi:hypothetical protein
MNHRTAAWLSWSLWAVCVALIGLALLLDFLTDEGVFIPRVIAGPSVIALIGALSLAYPTFGALIASRLPTNPIGWIFCGTGLLTGVGVLALASGHADYTVIGHTGSLPGGKFMAWISPWIGVPVVLLAGALFLLFPSGRLH